MDFIFNYKKKKKKGTISITVIYYFIKLMNNLIGN